MASKFESRQVKVLSKQERVDRMKVQFRKIIKEAEKNGGKLGDNITLTEQGLVFTRGSLKEYDNEQGDLYGYLHYGLMRTSNFIEQLPKDTPGKQKYLYRIHQ